MAGRLRQRGPSALQGADTSAIAERRSSRITQKATDRTSHDSRARNVPEDMLPIHLTEWRRNKYKLNESQALGKKLKATNRAEMYCVDGNGAGLNIICQAGLYELFRRTACQHYANFRTAGSNVSFTVQTDLADAIVQVTFKVKTYGGQTSYVIDLYHTCSSIRVSGRNYHKFFDDDWPSICDEIAEMNKVRKCTEPDTLNETMRRCLEQVVEKINAQKLSKKSQTSSSRPHEALLQDLEEASQPTEALAPALLQEHTPPRSDYPRPLTPTELPSTTALHSSCTGTPMNTQPTATLSDITTRTTRREGTSTPPHTSPNMSPHQDAEALYLPPPRTSIQLQTQEVNPRQGPEPPTAQLGATSHDQVLLRPEPVSNRDERNELLRCREELLFMKERQFRQDTAKKEAELAARERKLNLLQRELNKREKDIHSQEEQHQALKINMTSLERRLRELTEERNVLSARITALETQPQQQEPNSGNHRPEQTSRPNCRSNTPTTCSCQHSNHAPAPNIIISPHFGNIEYPSRIAPTGYFSSPMPAYIPGYPAASGYYHQPPAGAFHPYNPGLQQMHPFGITNPHHTTHWTAQGPPLRYASRHGEDGHRQRTNLYGPAHNQTAPQSNMRTDTPPACDDPSANQDNSSLTTPTTHVSPTRMPHKSHNSRQSGALSDIAGDKATSNSTAGDTTLAIPIGRQPGAPCSTSGDIATSSSTVGNTAPSTPPTPQQDHCSPR